MITNKDKIEQFKRELRSYRFYEKSIDEIECKLIELNNRMIGLSSPQPKEVVAGAVSVKYHHDNKLELMIEEEHLIAEREYYLARIIKIDEVLNSMDENDANILRDLYMRRISYDVVSDEQHYSRSQLQRRVNSIIREKII